MTPHALRYSLLTSFVGATLAACGGSASPARAPESKAEPEVDPATIEEAQQQIARAQSRLAGGASKAADQPTAASEAAPSPEPAPPSEPSQQSATGKRGVTDAACSSPCRALASMRRAVTALCRMTGDTDARCLDAKRTLTDSEGRVTPCTCS